MVDLEEGLIVDDDVVVGLVQCVHMVIRLVTWLISVIRNTDTQLDIVILLLNSMLLMEIREESSILNLLLLLLMFLNLTIQC